jgi:hypothetical protein
MPSNKCFISYRRATSAFVARAVFQDLRAHAIDVFLDVESMDEGDVRREIDSQIRARPYFLPILSPAALKRCLEPADLLRKEFAIAVDSERRIVPLVTTEFDRKEISDCLPEALATRFLALNTITLVHELFNESMAKLRNRFLKPVDLPEARIDSVAAQEAERLTAVAAQVPIGQTVLAAQRHLERAFAAAPTRPELAAKEFSLGADLLEAAPQSRYLLKDLNLAVLQLQAAMQRENLIFTTASNVLKTRHEAAKRSISQVR